MLKILEKSFLFEKIEFKVLTAVTSLLLPKSIIGKWKLPIIFGVALSLAKRKKYSIINSLSDTAHPKRSTFAKHLTILKVFVYPRV